MVKILIIKLGYSETLDSEISKTVSLGDVLRTTPLLEALKEKYPESKIIFLADIKAKDLVDGNPYIDKLLLWDEFIGFLLLREKFDVVINLEKHPGICALTDMIDAWQKFGFRLGKDFSFAEYEKNVSFIDYINNKQLKKDYWQKVLIEHLGIQWKEQKYSLGYMPKNETVFDIGLNFQVGSKWPTKAMSTSKWDVLYNTLTSQGYIVDWQRGLNSIKEYIEWINSAKLIITQDSLGLHLAMALDKKVIALFGSTGYDEVFPYGEVVFITPNTQCPKSPCYQAYCDYTEFCMDTIELETITAAVKGIL
jgi:heptosyltransferase-2